MWSLPPLLRKQMQTHTCGKCGKVTQSPNWSPKVTHCTSAESAFPDRNCQAAWDELTMCRAKDNYWRTSLHRSLNHAWNCMNILIYFDIACESYCVTVLLRSTKIIDDHCVGTPWQYKHVTDSTATLDMRDDRDADPISGPTADGWWCWWSRGHVAELMIYAKIHY